MRADRRVELEVVAGEDLHRYRAAWVDLSRESSVTPFGFPGFFAAWREAFTPDRTGFAVIGVVGSSLELILPLWCTPERSNDWNSLGAFRADYTEATSRDEDPEIAAAFWTWLTRRAPCRSARLARIPADSYLGRTIPATAFERRGRMLTAASSLLIARRARYLTTHIHDEHPYADRTQIELQADRLERSATRRNLKMLEKYGAVAYETVFGTRELLALLPTLFDMHVANFAGTGRASQFENANEQRFVEALAIQPDLAGVIYMDVLRVGGRPVAMHLGFQHGGRIYYNKPTFDLDLGKASPGKTLLAYLFARAKQQGIERVDLLKGTESYKSDWANHSRRTITTMLVERGLRELARATVGRS